MSDNNHSGLTHSQVPIDWWPGGLRSAVIIPRSRLTKKLTLTKADIGVTKLRQWEGCPHHLREDFGQRIFGGYLNSPGPGQDMVLLFDPPLLGEVDAEPETFVEELVDIETTEDEYSWPNILLDLRIILDNVKADYQSQNRIPIDRSRWIDGVTRPTRTIKRIYASRTEPPKSKQASNRPWPTPIRGDFYGHPIRIPACLHPLVQLTSAYSDDATVFKDVTPTVEIPGDGNAMRFAPTNHLRWITHISDNKATKDGGMWRRVEVTREAIPMPRINYL